MKVFQRVGSGITLKSRFIFFLSPQRLGELYVFKKLAQILALAVPLVLVACGGSTSTTSASDTTTTTTAAATTYAGTYKGSVSGVNAGTDASITISSANVVTGTWTITNRGDDGLGSYVTTFSGSIDSAGVFKADGTFRGLRAMQFNGKIDLTTGVLSGTWFEYEFPEKGGTFSLKLVGSTTTTTATGSSSCTGSYVGSIVPPPYEVRIANRNRQLIETGFPITGNDAVDNANTTGGGVDGGMYLEGSYAWETDANCVVTKGTAVIFGYQFSIDGKVNADKTFTLNYFGPIIGSVDANNNITGQLQEGGKTWVYGELRGKFTPNGKI